MRQRHRQTLPSFRRAAGAGHPNCNALILKGLSPSRDEALLIIALGRRSRSLALLEDISSQSSPSLNLERISSPQIAPFPSDLLQSVHAQLLSRVAGFHPLS